MFRRSIICLSLLLSLTAGLVSAQQTDASRVTYYAILLDGKKIGHTIRTRIVTAQHVTTTETMSFTMHRFETAMTIFASVEHRETPDGKPLAFKSVTRMPPMAPQMAEGVVTDGKIQATITNGEQKRQVSADWPKGALLNEGLQLLQRRKGLQAGTTFTASLFQPDQMQAFPFRITVMEAEAVDLFGRVVTLTPVRKTISGPTGAITMTDYVDADFHALKSVVPVAGMSLELVACDSQFALSPNDVVDVLDKSLVASPVTLSPALRGKSLTFHLTPRAKQQLRIPGDDTQTVALGDDGTVRVTVKPTAIPAGAAVGYDGDDAEALAALKPSQYVQSDDKRIVALARKAVGDAADAADALKRLESFVTDYIDGTDLSIGYASATEVVKSRRGDCTEFAVLLAAMCRASGMPAQVIQGIAYIDRFGERKNVFVGHAWVRCYVAGRWVHLDSAMGSHDTAHIMLGQSDGPNQLLQLLTAMGQFKIARIDGPDGQALPAATAP